MQDKGFTVIPSDRVCGLHLIGQRRCAMSYLPTFSGFSYHAIDMYFHTLLLHQISPVSGKGADGWGYQYAREVRYIH